MSAQHHAGLANAAFAMSRQNVLAAAVAPLLEGLETRSHFSVSPVANPGGPYSINEGQSVTITGLGSTDSDGTVASYQWDTNYDANKGFKNRVTTGTWKFIADSSGSRTIALRVTDNNGDVSSIQTATINIADVAPTLTLNAPNTATEAEPVDISWSYSDPSAADVVTAWTVAWGDGSTSNYAGSANAGSHLYTEDGSYTVTLTATQADGQTSVTHNVVVANNPPVVLATTPRDTIDEGENVQLDFSSPNRAGSLDGWKIDWGDGQVEIMEPTRSHAAHFYTDSGVYTAVITAQEPDGGNGSESVVFTVGNVAADVAITNVPTTGLEGTAITVGSTVSDAGQDDTHTYGWTVYRDGSQFQLPNGTTLNGQSFTFTPTDNGEYTVRLSVLDDEGAITTVNSDPIVVANVDPTATITGTPLNAINEGTAVNLTAVPADAGDEDTFTYAWSVTKGGNAYALPDGTNVTSAAFSFTPNDNGVYVAIVKVTDKDGGDVTIASTSFSVNNVAPTASITAPTTANEGATVDATSTVVDPGTADEQTYAWTVEKLTGGGNGTLTTDSFGSGELDDFDWGTDFTITSRLSVDSSMADGTGSILHAAWDNTVNLIVNKSGTDIGITLEDGNGTNVSTPANAAVADTFFDLAVTYNGTTGATEIFINGTSVASGTMIAGLGGSHHTHFAEQLEATFDSLGVYHAELSAQDIASIHNDIAIATNPADFWDFGEAAGSYVATSDNGHDLYTGGTFSGSSMFVPYSLPSNAVTNGAAFAFVPTDNGTYRLKLTVTDDDTGTVNTTSSDIVVANVAPTAEITGDTEGVEGTALSFNVAASDAGTDDTHTYLWSVKKDNVNYNLNGATANATAFSFMPVDNGSYDVSVLVTDKDGGTVTKTVTVVVANADPVVTITGAPTTGTEGQSISLGSTTSDAGTDDVIDYLWSVTKDNAAYDLTGITRTSSSFAFTPEDNGTYVVTLLATDNDGGTDSISTAAIVVANVDPTGVITGEPIAPLVEGAQADLLVTPADDGVVDTFTYAWTIKKDGQAWTPLAGTTLDDAALSFVPTDNGSYIATVVITDKDGGDVSVDSQPILVVNANPAATITGAPVSGTEGTAISLGSTVTDDGVADEFTYAWSVTKDSVAVDLTGIDSTSESFAFTPTDNGAYVFTLVVTDDDNGTVTTSASLTVNNANPVPTISGDSSVNEAQAITLTVAANDPGSIDTHTYLWSVTKNGQNYTTGLGATNAAAFTFTPNLYGTYEVSCVVTDNNGGTATATKTVTATNVAPTATISGVPTGVRGEGSPITLTGLGTDVAAETGLTYAWSVKRDNVTFPLPNGTNVSGTNFEFTPTDNGKYKVTLVVTDSGGLTGSTTTSNITVTNALPNAEMTGVPTGPVNEGTAISLNVDAADPGAEDTLSYAWTVTKNGSSFALPNGTTANAAAFTFTPTDNGTYVATCVVTDDDGGPTMVASGAITVANVAPDATITGTPSSAVSEGSAIALGATVVDPGSLDTFTYSWSVTKNGQPYLTATAPSATAAFGFTPTDNGTYVATVVVNDGLATDTVSTTNITVNNVNPAGSIGGPTTGVEGSSLTLTTTATDAGSADTLGYAWTAKKDGQSFALPNGILTDAATLVYTPADQGSYEFTCVVTDDDNGSVTLTHTVAVTNANPVVTQTGAPTTGVEGTAITVGSTATDAGDDTLSYGWTVYRNTELVPYESNVNYTGPSLTFTPQDNGSYVVRLSVTDEDTGITTVNSSPIVVANANPVAAITGDTTGTEGQVVEVGSTVTDAGPADTTAGFTYAWTIKRGNTTVDTGDTASHSFTPSVHGSYTVRLVVTDKDGGTTTTNSTIAVGNVAPSNIAIAGMPSSLTEGTAVSLTASASDASGDTVSYAWQVKRGDTVFATGTGANIAFTAARGPGEVIVTATDTAGAVTSRTFEFYVDNTAPTASLAGPVSNVLIGSSATLTATFNDVPTNQAMTVAWDFGDGTTASGEFTGGGVTSKKHTYAAVGSYTVTATINDGVDSTVVTQTVNVSNAAIVADPMSPTKYALYVVGTAGADNINVSQMDSGKYRVMFNGTSLGTNFDPSGRIYVYGNGGANTIAVSGQTNAVVFAGDAGSNVSTGSGNDVIVGTAGADRLAGNDGRDLIIGAAGPDVLVGGQGDDLIVAAGLKSTDLANLSSIMDKWTNTSNDIAKRRANLLPLFSTKTLIADAGSNQIYGEAGNDWLVVNTSADRLRDLAKTDLVN